MDVVLTILGSAGLFTFIEFLINRKDKKTDKQDEINKRLERIEARLETNEKDQCRTQLLLFMADYPDEVDDILTLAHHYFVDLQGNWVLTNTFNRWIEEHNIKGLEWYKK